MNSGSIRLRLWLTAAISIALALAIAGVGLIYLFERHVERRIEGELTIELNQLIAATRLNNGLFVVTQTPNDPRFSAPLSGYYWQIEDLATGALTRSRSLWDEAMALPPRSSGDGSLQLREIKGPASTSLIALERVIIDGNGRSFRAAVAEDHRTVAIAVAEYATELAPAVLFLAIILIAANFAQISIGLRPLERLRLAVHEVIARRRTRLDVEAPTEVRPLADEINRLLDGQEKTVLRARSRATDLAHGLKTPLQLLSSDIRALRAKGEDVLAEQIEKSSAAIQRHVERELARARLAPDSAGGGISNVAEVANDVIGVVRRTPSGSLLIFDVGIQDRVHASVDPGDLAEVLGNLIENAARFASSSIRIEARETDDSLIVVVVDDGPGIRDADKDSVLRRGVKLGAGPGTGLGLGIVSDIVEAYGGRVELTDARPGLKVTLVLPKGATSRYGLSPTSPVPAPCPET